MDQTSNTEKNRNYKQESTRRNFIIVLINNQLVVFTVNESLFII